METSKGSGKRLQPSTSESLEPDTFSGHREIEELNGFELLVKFTRGLLEGFDDFTIASSWERFIAGVETACREWVSIPRPQLLGAGAEKVEGVSNLYKVNKELSFESRNYRLEFFLQASSQDGREEWKEGLHPLQIFFNVTDFLVISPSEASSSVVEISEASLLLSTVAVALANCGSQLPAFVPVHESKRKAYQGILGTKTYSMRFDADRITTWVPVRFMHLEGLYDLYVAKLNFKTAGDLTSSNLNVEFTMRLTYQTVVPSSRNDTDVEGSKENKDKAWDSDCPWAAWHTLEDPIKGFELVTIWRRQTVTSSSQMAEHENASTLDADKWLLSLLDVTEQKFPEKEESVGFSGRLPSLVLAFHVASEANFLEDFAAADEPYIQHITQSLDLPDPVEVDQVLKEVFQEGQTITGCGGMDQEYAHGVKGAPADSLFARFCLHALQLGGCNVRAIAVLWIEFVREVRLFWDQGDRLPRMSIDAPPDLATCHVHQKLQLLALCIRQKAQMKTEGDATLAEQKKLSIGTKPAEIKQVKVDTSVTQSNEDVQSDYLSSEENWDNINEEQLEMDSVFMPQEEVRKKSTNHVGKLTSQGSQRLQEPVIKNEVADIDIQSKITASEMAAFKAAKPGSPFEDFLQLHPPQDVSQLINAMDSKSLDNFWREIWDNIEAHPAEDQKPLFDYTREAEKVMHYLDTLPPEELLAQVLTTSYLLVADGLKQSLTAYMVPPSLAQQLEELYATMASLLPSLDVPKKSDGEKKNSDIHIDLLHLCSQFEKVAADVLLAVSLGKKLKRAPRLLAAFLDNYLGRKTKVAPRLVVESLTSRQWKDGGASEREVVTSLFPQLGATQAWRKSLRMGNFLNGHEPAIRETIFSCCYNEMDNYPDGSQRQRTSTQDYYTHRMYISGTSSDLQVALSTRSFE